DLAQGRDGADRGRRAARRRGRHPQHPAQRPGQADGEEDGDEDAKWSHGSLAATCQRQAPKATSPTPATAYGIERTWIRSRTRIRTPRTTAAIPIARVKVRGVMAGLPCRPVQPARARIPRGIRTLRLPAAPASARFPSRAVGCRAGE